MTTATDPLDGFEERFLERRGVRIRCFTGGEGPVLLLVHGYGGSAWNFSELAPLLATGRRLLIPDLPGHGGSSPLPAAPNLAAYADPLAGLCDGEVDVVGHSLGGAVALRLAARRPGLVRRIVLAAAAGISSHARAAEFFLSFFGIVQPGRLAGRRPDVIARSLRLRRLVFPHFSVSDPLSLTERAVVGLLRGPTLHTDVLSAANALVREDPRPTLDAVTSPVLCLWGAQDAQVPLDDAFQYARRLRARLRVIPDCGHLLIAERPDACANAIEGFLG